MTAANDLAVRRALETAGIDFIDENGGGPGVRLRKRQRAKQSKSTKTVRSWPRTSRALAAIAVKSLTRQPNR